MRLQFVCCLLLVLVSPALAQHGAAPNGYYPPGYNGDTWTGEVSGTNDATREITLTYTKGSKSETFTGVLQPGFKAKRADGSTLEVKPSDFRNGTRLTVFYMPKTRKEDDKKIKYYEIFQFQYPK
jgi:hypothetical protein